MAATVNVTGTEPLPFAFDSIEIHSTLDAAVQVHCALEARTSTLPLPPLRGRAVALLDSSNRHSPAACDTCARWPLIITPPVREVGSAFAAAANWTAPGP